MFLMFFKMKCFCICHAILKMLNHQLLSPFVWHTHTHQIVLISSFSHSMLYKTFPPPLSSSYHLTPENTDKSQTAACVLTALAAGKAVTTYNQNQNDSCKTTHKTQSGPQAAYSTCLQTCAGVWQLGLSCGFPWRQWKPEWNGLVYLCWGYQAPGPEWVLCCSAGRGWCFSGSERGQSNAGPRPLLCSPPAATGTNREVKLRCLSARMRHSWLCTHQLFAKLIL